MSNIVWLAVVLVAAIWIVRLRIRLAQQRAYCSQLIRERALGVRLAMRLRDTCRRAGSKQYIATLGLEQDVSEFWREFYRH